MPTDNKHLECPECPECLKHKRNALCVSRVPSGGYRCNQCGHQFHETRTIDLTQDPDCQVPITRRLMNRFSD